MSDLAEQLQMRIDELEDVLKAYLLEYDAPVPDYTLRRKYRDDLRGVLRGRK